MKIFNVPFYDIETIITNLVFKRTIEWPRFQGSVTISLDLTTNKHFCLFRILNNSHMYYVLFVFIVQRKKKTMYSWSEKHKPRVMGNIEMTMGYFCFSSFSLYSLFFIHHFYIFRALHGATIHHRINQNQRNINPQPVNQGRTLLDILWKKITENKEKKLYFFSKSTIWKLIIHFFWFFHL